MKNDLSLDYCGEAIWHKLAHRRTSRNKMIARGILGSPYCLVQRQVSSEPSWFLMDLHQSDFLGEQRVRRHSANEFAELISCISVTNASSLVTLTIRDVKKKEQTRARAWPMHILVCPTSCLTNIRHYRTKPSVVECARIAWLLKCTGGQTKTGSLGHASQLHHFFELLLYLHSRIWVGMPIFAPTASQSPYWVIRFLNAKETPPMRELTTLTALRLQWVHDSGYELATV